MGARTLDQAIIETESLARRAMTGDAKRKKKYQGRAATMGEAIYRKFQVGPTKWRTKHVLWFFEQYCEHKQYKPATQNDYWHACVAVLHGLGRYKDLEPNLQGPWMTRTGKMPSGSNRGRKRMLKRQAGARIYND